MRRLLLLLVVLFGTVAHGGSRGGEFRGVWIHSARGIPGESWRETAKFLSENGFNALFVNFAWGDVAEYPSKVLPVHPDVEERGDDPLGECLAACHEFGLQLHFWKICWNMGHRTPAELREKMRSADRVQMTDDGKKTDFLAPHLPENRALEVAAIREVLERYPVDGIHLDYVRYSSSRCDFSPSARTAFEAFLGEPVAKWPEDVQASGKWHARFCEWRRRNNNELVRAVRDVVRMHRGVALSAAVYPSWDDSSVWIGQDAEKWARLGWVDALCPMNYTTEEQEWCAWLEQQLEIVQGSVALYPGIACHKLPGGEAVAKQIAMARKIGADGFVCFPYNARTRGMYPVLHGDVTSLPPGKVSMGRERRVFLSHGISDGRFAVRDAVGVGGRCQIRVGAAEPGLLDGMEAVWEKDGLPQEGLPPEAEEAAGGARLYSVPTQEAGWYRLCLRGEAGVCSRSPVVRVLTEEELREELLREGPPSFADDGRPRVAVWQDRAYGASTILESLRKAGEWDVAELRNFRSETLARCQAVVLPQPRYRQRLFRNPEMGAALERFVRNGGTLIVTHALVGARLFPNYFPDHLAAGSRPVAGSSWRGTEKAPATVGTGERHSTFVDMIPLESLRDAEPLAVASDGSCVVALCRHGLGRYVACGLGIGIGADDRDAALSPDDELLLRELLRIR